MMFESESVEQRAIRESVRKMAQSEIPRYQNEGFFGTVPLDLFKSFAELGLTGMAVSEEFGGLASGTQTAGIVLEEIAAIDLGCAIFLSVHNMVAGMLERFGSRSQKESLLRRLASGEWLAAFALTEPSAGSNASDLKTEARSSGNNYILNGEKCYISSAGWANLYIVFARSPGSAGKDGISAFLLQSDAKGLQIGRPEKKMGGELDPIASLHFENVLIPKDSLLGREGQGYKIALSGLAGGRVSIASCANGISRTALELALRHIKEREQFGQKLIAFQGLQFMLADMRMKLEASRLLTWRAARAIENDPTSKDARAFPSMAKCFASDSAMSITTDAVQLLGGAGYIQDYAAERLMREAKMLQIVEGTNQIQRIVIAREMAD